MSIFNPIVGRTSTLLTSNNLLSSLRRTQIKMFEAQNQLATGLRVNTPSQAPASTAAILSLQAQQEIREQHENNLQFAIGLANNIDHDLNEAHNIVIFAKNIASGQIGAGSNKDTRQTESHNIDAQIQQLLQIANQEVQGIALFGGRRSTQIGGSSFVEELGGIRYVGSTEDLEADVGFNYTLGLNTNGQAAFGALSARVKSTIDLNPQATAATRLANVNGTQNFGARLGTIQIDVDSTVVSVDLTTADTLGDVATRVNDAINSVDPTAGSLAVTTSGFALTANAGHTISINDQINGQTASDLGIVLSATAATVNGLDVNPKLSELTQLSALGVAVDLVSGLKITQGNQTKTADFSTANTVQDMINTVSRLQLGLRLEINETATGFNLVSEVSGIELSVGENAGGTTATDLGLRTFGVDTQLADFQHGLGIGNVLGQDDFAFQLHDGRTFNVNIDGVTTVGGLITAIQTAATTAGLTVGSPGTAGTDFNVGLVSDGNGFFFEDGTAGANDFKVTQLGTSLTATDLGIYSNAGSGNSITGADLSKVRVDSVFTHLIALRDSLVLDDSRGITLAGGNLDNVTNSLTQIRAQIGVRSQQLESLQERSGQLKIAEQVFLSELRDTDLADAITRLTQLQQQLQASMLAGSQSQQLSLLNFLR